MSCKVLIIISLLTLSIGSTAIAQDFRVQIAAYADSMPLAYFKSRGLERVLVSTDQMGLYRYFAGTYQNREQADAKLKEIIAKGFPNAVIVDLEEQRALGGATCPYNRPNRPIFLENIDDKTNAYYLYFELGSASLSAETCAEIDRVEQGLKANLKLSLQIIGQTDGLGDAAVNQELATSRARAVRNYLITKGIRTDRMTIKVYGEGAAALPNKDEISLKDLPENRKWNRRVVLRVSEPTEK